MSVETNGQRRKDDKRTNREVSHFTFAVESMKHGISLYHIEALGSGVKQEWPLLRMIESSFVVAFLVSSLLGACFANSWRNFDPPRVAPTQISKLFPTKRITSIRDTFNEKDHIHSFSLPLPSEDGVMRQQPRGVKMKESDFTCQLA